MVGAALARKTFTEVYLAGRIMEIVDSDAQMSLWLPVAIFFPGQFPTALRCSRVLVHTRGQFHSRQMLACIHGRVVVCGIVQLFIEFQLGATSSFFVFINLYDKQPDETWTPSGLNLIPAAAILRPVPFFQVSGMVTIYVGLPSYIV